MEFAAERFLTATSMNYTKSKESPSCGTSLPTSTQGPAEVLHTEERFSVKVGATTLVGRIDRIDRAGRPGYHRRLQDWKAEVAGRRGRKPAAFVVCAGGARNLGIQSERLVFHNLDGNSAISTERSDIQLDEARLSRRHCGTNCRGKFDAESGFHCYWCAYRILCPKTEKRIPQAAAPATDQVNNTFFAKNFGDAFASPGFL